MGLFFVLCQVGEEKTLLSDLRRGLSAKEILLVIVVATTAMMARPAAAMSPIPRGGRPVMVIVPLIIPITIVRVIAPISRICVVMMRVMDTSSQQHYQP